MFLEGLLLRMQRLEKVYRKLNGTLNVPLSTTNLGGGIQKALMFVECSQEHSKAQKISRYPKCILDIFFDVFS